MIVELNILILYFLELIFIGSVLKPMLNLKPISIVIELSPNIFIPNLSKIVNIVSSHLIAF